MGIRTRNISKFSPLRSASFIQHPFIPANDPNMIRGTIANSAMTVGTPIQLNGASMTLAPAGDGREQIAFHWPYCLGFFRSVANGGVDFEVSGIDQFGRETVEILEANTNLMGGAVAAFQTRNAFSFIDTITPLALTGSTSTAWEFGFSDDAFSQPMNSLHPNGADGGDGVGAGSQCNQIGFGFHTTGLRNVSAEDQRKVSLVMRETYVDYEWVDYEYHTFAVATSTHWTGFGNQSMPATIVHLAEGSN